MLPCTSQRPRSRMLPSACFTFAFWLWPYQDKQLETLHHGVSHRLLVRFLQQQPSLCSLGRTKIQVNSWCIWVSSSATEASLWGWPHLGSSRHGTCLPFLGDGFGLTKCLYCTYWDTFTDLGRSCFILFYCVLFDIRIIVCKQSQMILTDLLR